MVDAETMKWASLGIFVLQNAAFVLLMRASKVRAATKAAVAKTCLTNLTNIISLSQVNGTHYNSSVAVLVTEIIKLPLTVMLLCYEKMSIGEACSQMYKDIVLSPMDTLKISIPALLYTVQNNCLFIAVGHLEAAVFQVSYQLKTLTTAVLTVVLLGRKQQLHQWFALLLLTAGAAMVQEPKKAAANVNSDGSAAASALAVGLTATVVACVCSSVASVYLEKILVESKPSIWVRNAQLCLFTIPIAFVGTRMVEDKYIKEDGTPLHGFNAIVWAAILTNAAGGMLVATVMKFAGNILRNFAQALAIIVGGIVRAACPVEGFSVSPPPVAPSRSVRCRAACVRVRVYVCACVCVQGSWALFGFQITMPFCCGVFLVILSIFIYGAKAEQIMSWVDACKGSLGMQTAAQYKLVAQMEVHEEMAPMGEDGKGASRA